jgi:hypothetical protein
VTGEKGRMEEEAVHILHLGTLPHPQINNDRNMRQSSTYI